MAISIPRWTGMLRRAGAPARAATEIATEVDQTVDALVSQHEHDSAFDRLLYAMQLGFQHADARMDAMEARLEAMEARLEASFNKRILTALGIALTALAIATAIIVALFIQYAG